MVQFNNNTNCDPGIEEQRCLNTARNNIVEYRISCGKCENEKIINEEFTNNCNNNSTERKCVCMTSNGRAVFFYHFDLDKMLYKPIALAIIYPIPCVRVCGIAVHHNHK